MNGRTPAQRLAGGLDAEEGIRSGRARGGSHHPARLLSERVHGRRRSCVLDPGEPGSRSSRPSPPHGGSAGTGTCHARGTSRSAFRRTCAGSTDGPRRVAFAPLPSPVVRTCSLPGDPWSLGTPLFASRHAEACSLLAPKGSPVRVPTHLAARVRGTTEAIPFPGRLSTAVAHGRLLALRRATIGGPLVHRGKRSTGSRSSPRRLAAPRGLHVLADVLPW